MTHPVVVKVGGNDVDDACWLRRLALAVVGRPGVILVHGGGKEVSQLQRRLGSEPTWHQGLRCTPPEAMNAVSMVLSGLVNKRVVGALLGAGVDALGISGEDGALLRAGPAAAGTLGRTGQVVGVRADLLRTLLAAGLTPVVSPVSRGEDGAPRNVNADDAAAAIACALLGSELLLVSNVPGVLSGGRVLHEIASQEIDALLGSGTATGGMAPKLRAAARALAGGASAVRIGGLEMLGDPAAGSFVRADGSGRAAA